MSAIDQTLGENIRIFAQVVSEICQRNTLDEATDIPLTRNQFYLMRILATSGDFQVSDLARTLDISNAAASKNIDRLEKRGLVERRICRRDRRRLEVSLLPAGRLIVDEYHRITAEKQSVMLGNFTSVEKEILVRLLRQVIRHTLSEEQNTDVVCLQCGGRCGEACVIQDVQGICPRPQ